MGSAEAPPLVLLRGKRDHARSLDRLAAAFCSDYRVIVPDLRGHGDSDWAVGGYYGMSEHIADLLALIEVIGGQADVIGHSFGSRIALYTAGAFPARIHSVVAIEATVNFAFRGLSRRPLSEPEALRRWIARQEGYAAMQPRVYATLEEARERIQRVDSRLDDAFALELARYALRPVEGGYIWKFDPVWARPHERRDRCRNGAPILVGGGVPGAALAWRRLDVVADRRRWRRTGQPSATPAGSSSRRRATGCTTTSRRSRSTRRARSSRSTASPAEGAGG